MTTTRPAFRLLVVAALACAAATSAGAQTVFSTNFNVAGLLTANGWTATSGAGSNSIIAGPPALTYTGLPSSGVGNAASLTTSGEDVRAIFTNAITTGDSYTSLLINVSAAQAAGDYFYSFAESTSAFNGRLFARSTAGGFQLGIQRGSTTPATYDTNVLTLGTTYLAVIKLTRNPGTTDDVASLWINPALGGAEPAPNVTNNSGGTDLVNVNSVLLRQGTAGNAATVRVGAILVGTNWASVTPSAAGPSVTSFSPTNGPSGTSVVITGTGFTGATSVTFGGVSASFTIDSPTQITATVPVGAPTGTIGVTTPAGTGFSATQFVTPTITVVLPSSVLEGSSASGELTVPEAPTNDVTVTLTSSSTNDLTVESPVTIFQGTTNSFFNVTAPSNITNVGNTVVTVTPSATNYAAIPANITVINTDAVKIPLTSLATNSYTQDFNTLGTNTWTNAISPTVGVQATLGSVVSTNLNGWFATFVSGTATTNLVADDGNGTNSAVYNYGNPGGTNRSLGGLANGGAPAFGALISNSTSDTLRSVVINLTGKFWRSSSSVQNFLSFGYGEVDGTVVNNINFLSATNTNNVFRLPLANVYGPNPVPTNAVGPLDGNNITNQVQISNVAIPVDLAPGETMFIRWQDFDNSGFDAGLAIDDVSLTASTNIPGPVLGTAALDNLTLLQNAATVSSSVLTDGGSSLTSRGFVFSETFLNTNPVIGGPNTTVITNLPADVSAFTNTISGLLPSTSYTVKSFAISAAGTNYSPAISFNTLAPSPSFTGVYTQSFNGLTNTDLPSGWRAVSTGGIDSYAGDWNTAGSSGGFYGRTNIPGILGYRHTAATGILTNRLTLINNTGGTLTNLWVSYQGEVNTLTNTRFPEWTVVVQGQTNAALTYSTGAGSNEFKSAEITGLNISNGETITIGWWSDRGTNAGGSSRLIGMTDVRVATNAPPIGTPTINVTGSFTNFTTTVGTASASQSIVASGTNLVGDIEVTTPAFYQVSTDNTNFSGALNLAPSGGVVSNTTLFVRLAANAPVGSPAGTVLLGSTNATIQTRSVTGTVFSTYTAWLNGAPTNTANLLKYAIGGASSPTATDGTAPSTAVTSSNLSITAIVRTNDPALDVLGEGLTNLSVGPWSTNGVTQTVSTNQAGVPTGTERQIFSIPRGTNTSQFLRLDSILQP